MESEWWRDKRKVKRRSNRRRKRLRVGSYSIDCRGHPGIIIRKGICDADRFGDDVDIESLVDGTVGSCSIMHCVPETITKQQAEAMAEAMNKGEDPWIQYNTYKVSK